MNFCSHCGSDRIVRQVPAGDNLPRSVCAACGTIHYENPKIVVGCLPEWDGRVLLCKRAIEPRYGLWTLPAGFLENGESVVDGALRETAEEANARVAVLDLYTLISLPQIHQVYVMFRHGSSTSGSGRAPKASRWRCSTRPTSRGTRSRSAPSPGRCATTSSTARRGSSRTASPRWSGGRRCRPTCAAPARAGRPAPAGCTRSARDVVKTHVPLEFAHKHRVRPFGGYPMKRTIRDSLVILAAAVALAAPASAQQFINILTGGTSGVYYPLGVALSQIYRQGHSRCQVVGPGHQGVGREPEPAAGGPRRARLHPGRCAVRRVEGQRGCRLQDAAQEAARRGGDLSQLHPDRGQRRLGHQDARRPEGQADLGRRAEVGNRAQRAGDPEGGGPHLPGLREGRVPAVRRIGRAHQEPAARRHAAVRGPRRLVDPRPRHVAQDRRGRRFPPTWSPRSGTRRTRPGSSRRAPTKARPQTCRPPSSPTSSSRTKACRRPGLQDDQGALR